MKTLLAIALICLSFQSFAEQSVGTLYAKSLLNKFQTVPPEATDKGLFDCHPTIRSSLSAQCSTASGGNMNICRDGKPFDRCIKAAGKCDKSKVALEVAIMETCRAQGQ